MTPKLIVKITLYFLFTFCNIIMIDKLKYIVLLLQRSHHTFWALACRISLTNMLHTCTQVYLANYTALWMKYSMKSFSAVILTISEKMDNSLMKMHAPWQSILFLFSALLNLFYNNHFKQKIMREAPSSVTLKPWYIYCKLSPLR